MGILTVGLLGVASIFPVAAFYMQKGDVADNGSAIAQAAFNDALARGMLDPQNWLMLQDATGVENGRFSKRFSAGLRDQLATMATSTATPPQKQQIINRSFGSAYIIDPLACDQFAANPADPTDRRQARFVQTLPFGAMLGSYAFPALVALELERVARSCNQHTKWPLVRVTLPQPSTDPTVHPIWPMTTEVADRLFRSSDDLALDVPTAK